MRPHTAFVPTAPTAHQLHLYNDTPQLDTQIQTKIYPDYLQSPATLDLNILTVIMTFSISSDAITALNPVSLPEEASVIHADDAAITWSAASVDAEKQAIKVEDVVLVTQVSGGGYLILALKEGQPDEKEAFQLSSFQTGSLPQAWLDRFLLKDLPDSLKDQESSSLDVLVSTRSGTGLSEKFYNGVLHPLLSTLGLKAQGQTGPGTKTYNVTHTKDANTVKQFTQQRWGPSAPTAAKNETVILLSGDGGIVDLLNGATPTSTSPLPTIALIPLGTGNALFHSLHKPHYTITNPPPSHLVLALRALLTGRAAPLPTFQASFSPPAQLVNNDAPGTAAPAAVSSLTGAIVASYGFHSQLVWESDTPAYRVHGAARFGMVAEELLKAPHEYRASVETRPRSSGGEEVKEVPSLFNYVLVTLVSNLEKTFAISPASRPLDGVLRLVQFGGATGARTMEIMMGAYGGGKHVEMEGVGYRAVEEVRVTTEEEDARWRKVCIDGTIVELPKGGTMVVERSTASRLQVLVLDA